MGIKYRAHIDGDCIIRCYRATRVRYFASSRDYVAKMDFDGKPKFEQWNVGDFKSGVFFPPSIKKILEETKSEKEALSIISSKKFEVKMYFEDRKAFHVFEFDKNFFTLAPVTNDNNKDFDKRKAIIAAQEEAKAMITNCGNAFNVLSAIGKKTLTPTRREAFLNAVFQYNELVKRVQSIEGLDVQVQELNLQDAAVRVNQPVGKPKFVKKKKKPGKKTASKKKPVVRKVSGIDDDVDEVGVIPIIAILIIGAVVVVSAAVLTDNYIRRRNELAKVKAGFDQIAKNNQYLLEVEKAVAAKLITPVQGKELKDRVVKQNEVVQTNVIEPLTKRDESMFDGLQKTIITAGIVFVGINLIKK